MKIPGDPNRSPNITGFFCPLNCGAAQPCDCTLPLRSVSNELMKEMVVRTTCKTRCNLEHTAPAKHQSLQNTCNNYPPPAEITQYHRVVDTLFFIYHQDTPRCDLKLVVHAPADDIFVGRIEFPARCSLSSGFFYLKYKLLAQKS